MVEQDTLFDMEGRPRPGRPKRQSWGGSKSTNARAKCRTMMPCPCWRCGKLLTPDMPEDAWQAGHTTDRAFGGNDNDVAPECSRCNTSAGGKLGASITNARHQPAHLDRERVPQWW